MPNRIKKLTFLFALYSFLAVGQQNNPIDSLISVLESDISDSSKVLVYDDVARLTLNTDPTKALAYAKEGLQLAESKHFTLGRARMITRIGTIMRANGNYSEALKMYFDSIEIADKIGDKEGVAKTLNSIGILYGEQNDFANSIANYKKSEALAKEIGDSRVELITKMNLAADFALLGDLDSALHYNDQALEMAATSNESYIGRILSNIGNINFQKGNYKEASENLRKSILTSEASRDKYALSQTYLRLAEVFKKTNEIDSAIIYAEKSLKLCQETKHLDYEIKANAFLSEVFESSNLTKSFQYYKSSIAAKDSLFNIEKSVSLRRIEFNEEIKRQELEDARQAANSQQKIGILIGLLIGFALLGAVIYRNYLQKARTNKLLVEQNTAIETNRTELRESLIQLKNTQTQLIQAEKLASMGELTAGIAHEIQNPMNFVNNFSEVSLEILEELKEEIKEPSDNLKALFDELKESQEKTLKNGKRASSIIQGMLEHSRGQTGETRAIDINGLCEEYLNLSFHGMRARDKSFNSNYEMIKEPNLPQYVGVVQDLSRVFLNLINNAFYTVNKKKKTAGEDYKPMVRIETKYVENEYLEVRVVDNGAGISEANIGKIFQPFFTTKPTGDGTGLGLSISYDIITKGNNGSLEVESEEGEGATFIVRLPLKADNVS